MRWIGCDVFGRIQSPRLCARLTSALMFEITKYKSSRLCNKFTTVELDPNKMWNTMKRFDIAECLDVDGGKGNRKEVEEMTV